MGGKAFPTWTLLKCFLREPGLVGSSLPRASALAARERHRESCQGVPWPGAEQLVQAWFAVAVSVERREGSLLYEQRDRPSRRFSLLGLGQAHAEQVQPDVADARRSVANAALHVPKLIPACSVRVWALQHVAPGWALGGDCGMGGGHGLPRKSRQAHSWTGRTPSRQ